ncbi:alpha amylase, catalytic domain protein [Mycobacterium kansasii]|uniref:Alpha amylase, catalytic domain protein n=1 Tax=Mycobacterium kansasii TaxID=1768 RepID=A0A1V3W9G0_MYCKA|nr:alpha amylase, catalytic domain protein [Mycobacterium kansasii]
MVEHPDAKDFGNAAALPADPTWFKHAVFYEVLVRLSTIPALTARVTCVDSWTGWTTCSGSASTASAAPVYDSPLRDGGYDIATSTRCCPTSYRRRFVALVDAAHRRGIRVITDLVMNHTSESHPWFQESAATPTARTATTTSGATPVRSTRRPDHLRRHRRVELDVDPVRRQFYWHRFFSHQPDLNYDNRRSRGDDRRHALLAGPGHRRVPAGRGPLPFRARGHQLRKPARDARLPQARPQGGGRRIPGRVLLPRPTSAGRRRRVLRDATTARRMPHAFHFPLMPRIFMAVRRESRFRFQRSWRRRRRYRYGAMGIFLRNHDELTLEMVTDEERDYMYAEYAKDPRMKANVGIRRRLRRCWITTATRSSCSTRCCSRCRLAGAVLRRRNRHG